MTFTNKNDEKLREPSPRPHNNPVPQKQPKTSRNQKTRPQKRPKSNIIQTKEGTNNETTPLTSPIKKPRLDCQTRSLKQPEEQIGSEEIVSLADESPDLNLESLCLGLNKTDSNDLHTDVNDLDTPENDLGVSGDDSDEPFVGRSNLENGEHIVMAQTGIFARD